MYSNQSASDRQFTEASKKENMIATCTHCGASWPLTGVNHTNRDDMGCSDCGSHEYYVKKGNSQRGA